MLTMILLTAAVVLLFLVNLLIKTFPDARWLAPLKFLRLARWQWGLLCICFLVLFCVGCGSTDAVFTVVIAALEGVDIVISGLGTLIAPSEASLVEGAVAAISALVSAVQAAWDTYEANPSAAGALAALEAAVASLQNGIPGILADLHITNPTLQAWITTIVGLVGKLAAAIAADILPKLAEATDAHLAGDSSKVKALAAQFNELTKAFVTAHNAALDASGLPPTVIAAVHKSFNKKAEKHFKLLGL